MHFIWFLQTENECADSSEEDDAHLSSVVNTMAADGLATQGARASPIHLQLWYSISVLPEY